MRNSVTVIIDYPDGAIKPFILGSSRLGSIKQGGDGHVFSVPGDTSLSSVQYNRTQIKAVNVKVNNTNNNSQVFYGVSAGNGNIELVDIDGNILEFAKMDFLRPELPVRIYFNAPDRAESENITEYESRIKPHMVGNLKTERFKYFYGNASVGIDLQDDILMWGSIAFSGIPNEEGNTAYTFFQSLNSTAQNVVNMSPETTQHLQSIPIPDGFMLQSNLMDAFNLFCWAVSATIYKNKIGEIWLTI